jgi:type 1 glutamine amidotransferase
MKRTLSLLAALAVSLSLHAAPKHVLVVTATQGFRHSSIPLAEKVIAGLGEQTGLFTVDYARGGADGKDSADIQQKMTRDALKNYDAIIFANTTGDLPLPEKEALVDFVKSGKGFVGMHSASDTFHGWRPYIDMLGGEFRVHYEQARITCVNQDPHHPSTRHLGPTFTVLDEIYLMTNFNRANVHGILGLDKHPNESTLDKRPNEAPLGDYPVAWSRQIGKGRLFYTSLGHREDVWLSEDYQRHILGGIKWALDLEEADAKPQDTTFHVSKEERKDGFKPLFNGKNTDGWKPRNTGWKSSWTVQNGALVNTVLAGGHGVDLITEDKYKDFVVRYEYMVPKKSNSGFYLRGRHEIQISDDTEVKEPGMHSNGAVYVIAPASAPASRKIGEWQSVEARMVGNKVTVFLNGVKIHDNLVVDKATGGQLDDKVGDAGPFMLQGDHGNVSFRNIRVKKL